MKKARSLMLWTIFITSIMSNISLAVTPNNIDTSKLTAVENPKPNVTFWGLGGDQVIGRGQGLMPLGGDDLKSIFYTAIEAAGSFKKSNGYTAGVAAGYRNMVNNSYILGGYLFVDYNRSPLGHDFGVANPGIEALGNVWDLRLNGYITTTCRHWLGDEKLAEELGITQFERAFGHERYDHFVKEYEEAASGIDGEIGRRIPLSKTHSLKAYVGGYHYFMTKTDAITGIEGRIVYPINQYIALEARDSYDKVRKNVFMGGIRITFGGYANEDRNNLGLAARLSDPIEHNFGTFATANSVAVGKSYIDEGKDYHLPSSFWYFDNASPNKNSSGDGTFEHPFTAIDSSAYQSMIRYGVFKQNNITMYVATGIAPYTLNDLLEHRLPLPYGYSIFGRTANFTLAAKGTQRPELDGGMIAFGSNNISDIQINSLNQHFGSQGALFLNGTDSKKPRNVNINDININVSENMTQAFGIGGLNSYATINNSQINVNSVDKGHESIGIGFMENSALFVGNNNFIHATNSSTAPGETHASGIGGNSPVIIDGNNNQIIADATGHETRATGIFSIGNPIIVFGNNNRIIGNANGYDSRAGGIVDVGTTTIAGNNNQIIGNAAGLEGRALGMGNIKALDHGAVTLPGDNSKIIIEGSNNQIIANSVESDSAGIVNTGTLVISDTARNNQIIANSFNYTGHHEDAEGIANFEGSVVAISGINNQITVHSAHNAYGIYLDETAVASTLNVKNTIFNISAIGSGKAAGISMEKQTDASNIVVQNNIFNVATIGANSNAYGIYLPNAVKPTINGNIAFNIFSVKNFSMPSRAWGIYANSNWTNSAAWIREHNIWFNPTSKNPQQQVYTNGVNQEIRL